MEAWTFGRGLGGQDSAAYVTSLLTDKEPEKIDGFPFASRQRPPAECASFLWRRKIYLVTNLMRPQLQHILHPCSRLFATARTSPPAARQRRFPTLAQFLLRSRVLALYRSIVRATNRIPPSSSTRAEMKKFAREEFDRHRGVADASKIRYLLSTGKTEFERMQRYVLEQAAR